MFWEHCPVSVPAGEWLYGTMFSVLSFANGGGGCGIVQVKVTPMSGWVRCLCARLVCPVWCMSRLSLVFFSLTSLKLPSSAQLGCVICVCVCVCARMCVFVVYFVWQLHIFGREQAVDGILDPSVSGSSRSLSRGRNFSESFGDHRIMPGTVQ